MVLLLIFALLAGAGTALTPCVLPVLPALLSASATGGRRRPAGIVIGLVVCHTLAVVALATVIDGVGLASGTVRTGAVVVLAVFGAALIWPRLGDALERPLYRLARFGPKDSGHGFWSGLAVGGALGFVYAPCAGPILAAVVAAGATGGTTGRIVAVAVAYGVGSGVVLFALAVGGRKLFERVKGVGRGPALQRALGVVLVLTAVAMGTQLDVRFQTALADHLPQFIVNPTGGIERSAAAQDRLADVRGKAKFDRATAQAKPVTRGRRQEVEVPGPGSRSGIRGRRHVAQHERAGLAAQAARPRRADRLLDLHLHQLHPHASPAQDAGRALPKGGPERGGGAHARVPVRAQDLQRARGHRPEQAPLPGGPGQRATTSGTRTATSTGPPST